MKTDKGEVRQGYDEVRVKGLQAQNKLTIPLSKLGDPQAERLQSYLRQLREISKKTIKVIDSNDDYAVPFAAYDSLKQFADINFEDKEAVLNVELYHL